MEENLAVKTPGETITVDGRIYSRETIKAIELSIWDYILIGSIIIKIMYLETDIKNMKVTFAGYEPPVDYYGNPQSYKETFDGSKEITIYRN